MALIELKEVAPFETKKWHSFTEKGGTIKPKWVALIEAE
jgi:hypothetical protein